MPTYRARYNVIRELREKHRFTQEDAWERAGVAQGTYQAMENRKAFEEGREFKEANLEAVAILLGVTLPDIAHDIPQSKAARWLVAELDRVRATCRESDQQLLTPDLLLCLLKLEGSMLASAIQKEADMPLATLIAKLERGLTKISAEIAGFRDFEWEENRFFRRALEYAAMEKRDAHDGDLALAILQLGLVDPPSTTVLWLQEKLGKDVFSNVITHLKGAAPSVPATPVFPDSTLG